VRRRAAAREVAEAAVGRWWCRSRRRLTASGAARPGGVPSVGIVVPAVGASNPLVVAGSASELAGPRRNRNWGRSRFRAWWGARGWRGPTLPTAEETLAAAGLAGTRGDGIACAAGGLEVIATVGRPDRTAQVAGPIRDGIAIGAVETGGDRRAWVIGAVYGAGAC